MNISMIVHNPPNQGGIVQYCILLVNELNKIKGVEINPIGFKSLWPGFLYPGNEPDKDANAINFDVPSKNIITWYNPLSWVKAWFLARNVTPRKFIRAVKLNKFPGLLKPLQNIEEQSKWSG